LAASKAKIDGLVQGVSSSRDLADASLRTLAGLDGVARRIEKTVDQIGLVAMQTTMLAVSGSVEAARAGAAGKGFSLVSKDIRTLAREAADAIDAAKDTVRIIVVQIGELRRDLEQTNDFAQREIESNSSVIRTLVQLDSDVAALTSANDAIVRGADTILSAATQMADASRQIASAAEEAGTAALQAATAANEQSQGTEDLAAAVEEIASLADALKQRHG
jgi:methyl-accepting chemotaxis protein